MRIIIHTQYYPPEIGAPQTRLHQLARELVQRGMQVTVLTAMPNYPTGHIHAGYGGWVAREQLEGVRVVRTGIYATKSLHIIPRLVGYFSFVLSSALVGVWLVGRADYLVTESPPLFLGIAGWFLSLCSRARWIFNVSDLWPESAVELGVVRRGSLGYRVSAWLEGFCYRRAWAVTGQSKGILESIRRRFPRVRTYHLANGVDTEFFQAMSDGHAGDGLRVGYAGLHGLAQGLQQIVMAAHQLREDASVGFSLVGDGPEKQDLVRMAQGLGLQNVRFLEPMPQDKVPAFLGEMDALLVPLKVKLTGAVPSKLYEAMSVGKPVILIADGEAAEIVREAGCGIVVEPGDIGRLVEAVRLLKDHPAERRDMGARGRRAAVNEHDRARIAERFADFLRNGVEGELST